MFGCNCTALGFVLSAYDFERGILNVHPKIACLAVYTAIQLLLLRDCSYTHWTFTMGRDDKAYQVCKYLYLSNGADTPAKGLRAASLSAPSEVVPYWLDGIGPGKDGHPAHQSIWNTSPTRRTWGCVMLMPLDVFCDTPSSTVEWGVGDDEEDDAGGDDGEDQLMMRNALTASVLRIECVPGSSPPATLVVLLSSHQAKSWIH